MKREEKNQQTRRCIIEGAMEEFSKKGYEGSSLNTICTKQKISKGIIYYYFHTKDELFLTCVEECFSVLTNYLKEKLHPAEGKTREQMEAYFTVRGDFFREYPIYQPIFFEAVVAPPVHLQAEIQKCKKEFDDLNIEILECLLNQVSLRPSCKKECVMEIFRQFQDFINAKEQFSDLSKKDFAQHEENCKKVLDILLYGVIERAHI